MFLACRDLFLNLNFISRLIFGSIFMVLGVSPNNLLRSEILDLEELSPPEVKQFLKEHFASVPEKQVADEGQKEGVEWEVKYPERLPKPFNQGIVRTHDFPVEFKVKNTANEPLELNAYIESANESIAFVRTSPTRKWTWTPYPHHKSKLMGLDDGVKTQVLEGGQSVNFSLHAVYRPQFAISFYPGRLVLNYELAGHFSSGGKFESGPKRIEIPFAKEKILFVDDEPDILEQAKIFLEKENKHFNVKTAASAEKALKMLKIDKYDAIVSDYQMPEMDGIDFLKTLRKRGNDIPFIVFTGKGREEVAMKALNLGADRYLQKGGDPRSQYRVLAQAVVQEVQHKRFQENLRRVRQALRTLSACNQAIIRITDESELLPRICDIIVEIGGYRLAWIGYAEEDEEKTVCPVAQAGYEEGYLETLKITWADTERGRGPTGTAIRTGQPSAARSILTDPNFEPWREEALKRGYESSIALPLIIGGKLSAH